MNNNMPTVIKLLVVYNDKKAQKKSLIFYLKR